MNIVYRLLRAGEEDAAASVVTASFEKLIAPGYSEEGNTEFRDYAHPESIRARAKAVDKHVVFVAEAQGEIVGVAELRNWAHISLLFVAPQWLRKGIGRRLVAEMLAASQRKGQGVKELTVNSSPFAVPVYERLGFDVTGRAVQTNGLVSIPMRLRVTAT